MFDLNWTVPQLSFPLTVPLLGLTSYTYSCLLGLIVSVGGLTESTVRERGREIERRGREGGREIDRRGREGEIEGV